MTKEELIALKNSLHNSEADTFIYSINHGTTRHASKIYLIGILTVMEIYELYDILDSITVDHLS